jgi:hypothetical protein
VAALREQLAEAANARDSDRDLRKRCVCPRPTQHQLAHHLANRREWFVLRGTWQDAAPLVYTCVTARSPCHHAGQELIKCAGCRNLETLGRAEASLHTALREVAVLTAVLGGDGTA